MFQKSESTNRWIVKEYLLQNDKNGEPTNILIQEDGQIIILDKNWKELYTKTDNDSRRLEFPMEENLYFVYHESELGKFINSM
jgi:hypothetical protein